MIIIRADAGPEIGAGHVMRCLSVASALKKQGGEITFISADENAESMVRSAGFEFVCLDTDHRDMMGELPLLRKTESYTVADTVIVDSYFVSAQYVAELAGEKRVILFDDAAKQPYPADMVINYNIFAKWERYEELYRDLGTKPEFILGPAYVPLREEFAQTPGDADPVIEPKGVSEVADKASLSTVNSEAGSFAKRVLVLTGGADPCHVALRYEREILAETDKDEKTTETDIIYHFVVGALSGDMDEISRLSEKSNGRIVIHGSVPPAEMRKLMLGCDVAVSAAGSTLYELCACGKPTVTYISADNQIPAARAFSESGVMLSAGDARDHDGFTGKLFEMVLRLAQNPGKCRKMTEKALHVADGKGAMRIAGRVLFH